MQIPVCKIDELPSGSRKIVSFGGQTIGVFNVHGRIYALNNRCPHRAGALCEGPITGTSLPTDRFEYIYGRDGCILRCAWHGWEFEIESGTCLGDPRFRAKMYDVVVQANEIFVEM